MAEIDLQNCSDEELKAEAKRLRSFSLTNAVFIGFLIGIVVYSLIKNSFGFLMLIPLYLIYRLIQNPRAKYAREVERLMRERKLS